MNFDPFLIVQNLSKTEAASSDSKKLHKSGSLSHVCSEVNSGARSKVRLLSCVLIVLVLTHYLCVFSHSSLLSLSIVPVKRNS